MAKSKEEKKKLATAKKKADDAKKKLAKKNKAAADTKEKAKKEADESKAADAAAKKAEDEAQKAKKELDKLSKVSIADIESFRKAAITRRWTLQNLNQEAILRFGVSNVDLECLNKRQICFKINGKRIPEDGYFSVN
tara:strand:+ start:50 stop:460 length:411 start_codon:yes stop_codon:yes gene_type:complete